MALVNEEVYKGIPIPSAYHKINRITLDYANNRALVGVDVYYGQSTRIDNPNVPLRQAAYICHEIVSFFGSNEDSYNPLESAYLFLKTQEDYSNAVDA